MSNLIEIQGQIEKLQKQASDIKAREFDKTVLEIVAKMQAFGITVKDLHAATTRSSQTRGKGKGKGKGEHRSAPSRSAKTSTRAASTVAAKYRGPNGETWSGRGLTPRWLAALVTEGKKKEDFAIQS